MTANDLGRRRRAYASRLAAPTPGDAGTFDVSCLADQLAMFPDVKQEKSRPRHWHEPPPIGAVAQAMNHCAVAGGLHAAALADAADDPSGHQREAWSAIQVRLEHVEADPVAWHLLYRMSDQKLIREALSQAAGASLVFADLRPPREEVSRPAPDIGSLLAMVQNEAMRLDALSALATRFDGGRPPAADPTAPSFAKRPFRTPGSSSGWALLVRGMLFPPPACRPASSPRKERPVPESTVQAPPLPVIESTVLPVADPVAALPPRATAPGRVPLAVWLVNLIAVVVPFLGLIAAALFLWGWGFRWVDLGLLLGMYILTALGVTVGFHRLFTHRYFQANRVVQVALGVLGSMAVEGPLLFWVALHRRHHQHSDAAGDPHSPHTEGKGVLGLLHGLWHAHVGWVFAPEPPDLYRYVKDLQQSRLARTVSALFLVWAATGLLIPAAVGGLVSGTWMGAWLGLLWGGLVRIFFVHHVTWSVNSICHLWGRRPYRTGDQSRNNYLFGVLALGEGWHNTHHAFPTSARHGLRWWQPDVSYWVIRLLWLLGLARNVKLPTREAQARERRNGRNGPGTAAPSPG